MKIVALLLTMFAFTASAKEIVLINAGSSTGGQAVYAKEIASQMRQDNFVVEQKTTNVNCALAKTLWESSTSAIFITATNSEATTQRSNQACFIETTPSNYLYWLNSGVVSFCSAKDKTWADFTTKGSTNSVVVMADPSQEEFIKELGRSYENKTKTVRVHSFNDAMMLAKAGDVDFVFRVSIHKIPEFEGKCHWNHTEIQSKNILPNPKSFVGFEKFGEQMFLMYKGLSTSEVDAARLSIRHAIRNSEEIRKQVVRRGQQVYDWNNQDEFAKIKVVFFKGY